MISLSIIVIMPQSSGIGEKVPMLSKATHQCYCKPVEKAGHVDGGSVAAVRGVRQ